MSAPAGERLATGATNHDRPQFGFVGEVVEQQLQATPACQVQRVLRLRMTQCDHRDAPIPLQRNAIDDSVHRWVALHQLADAIFHAALGVCPGHDGQSSDHSRLRESI